MMENLVNISRCVFLSGTDEAKEKEKSILRQVYEIVVASDYGKQKGTQLDSANRAASPFPLPFHLLRCVRGSDRTPLRVRVLEILRTERRTDVRRGPLQRATTNARGEVFDQAEKVPWYFLILLEER